MNATSIRVLLVDDQELVRAGFRTILSTHPRIEVVGEAGTGIEAVERARELAPDVICLDVQMPDMDGIEATRIIAADPSVRSAILILTTFNREDYLFNALAAGASGFLLKNSSPEQLLDAVVAVAGGDALLSPQVTRSVIERFTGKQESVQSQENREMRVDPGVPVIPGFLGVTVAPDEPNDQSDPDAPESILTERELDILRHLARGLSNAEIAESLFVSEATVKTHVSNVLRKLSLRDRIQAVIYAYENGVA